MLVGEVSITISTSERADEHAYVFSYYVSHILFVPAILEEVHG